MKKVLSIALIAMAGTVAFSQTPSFVPEYKKLEFKNEGYYVSTVSDNGKYLAGANVRTSGTCVVYDTENDTYTYLADTLVDDTGAETPMRGMKIVSVLNDGMLIGSYGSDAMAYFPAIYKNGKWSILPLPAGREDKKGGACSGTHDGSIIVGWTLYDAPIIWKLNPDQTTYEASVLPTGENKDCFGDKPTSFTAYDISDDGKYITGAIFERSGAFITPCVWTRNDQGNYDAPRVLGNEICFNLDKPNPGPAPKYADYVTTQPGDPQYDEQIAAFKEATVKRQEAYMEYVTFKTPLGNAAKLSADGRYLTTTLKTMDPETRGISYQAIRFKIEDGSYVLLKNEGFGDTRGTISTDSGLTLATDGVANSYIYVNDEAEPVTLIDWLKNTHGVDISKDFNAGGIPCITPDESLVAGALGGNPSYSCYYVRLKAPSAIQSVQDSQISIYLKEGLLHIQGEAQAVTLYNMTGITVFSSRVANQTLNVGKLPRGIYLATVITAEGTHSFKVVAD